MADELPFQQDKPKEEKKSGLGLFGGKKDVAPDLSRSLQELTLSVNNIARRTRVLEDGFQSMRKKAQITDQNALRENKRINTEIRAIDSDINDLKRSIEDIKSKMMLIIKELKLSAKREDFDTLQKYINLWEPVNFVTQNEVERIVKRVMDDLKYLPVEKKQKDL